jgi:hypothetical protein
LSFGALSWVHELGFARKGFEQSSLPITEKGSKYA